MKALAVGMAVGLMAALAPAPGARAAESPPVFSIAWSEYPSWSTFGVAGETRVKGELLVDGAEGRLGSIEKKWGVDIRLIEADYDTCITMYGAKQCDMACLTNMDSLNPALGRKSVAILPTSTSFGADACIVTAAIKSIQDLKGKPVRGLDKSVSRYCWERNLEILGQKEGEYRFVNMDPAAAATAMQQGQGGFDAIVVWNPFVLSTLDRRKDCRILFDSTTIPGEIIDMVTMAQDSLDRPRGREAACAVIEAYYAICRRLADPKTQEDTLIALGEKFSHLKADGMRKVVEQTRFFATPEQGIALFSDGVVFPWKRNVRGTSILFTNEGFNAYSKDVTDKKLKEIMPPVVEFCVKHEIVPRSPVLGYGNKAAAPAAQLRFDASYIKEAAGGM